MNAIVFYRSQSAGEALLEYNLYDNKFAPGNLVVRKVLMAMLASVRERLDRLEVEYNDNMLVEKVGGRAADLLRFLGATKETLRENKQGGVTVSRTFEAELTPERLDYFSAISDVSMLPHYRLKEGQTDRVVFYFNQYLLLRLPLQEERRFYDNLDELRVPHKTVSVGP